MMLRRTLDGALKCALRDFRREEWRATKNCQYHHRQIDVEYNLLALTLAIVNYLTYRRGINKEKKKVGRSRD
jgi:hypothetical protein